MNLRELTNDQKAILKMVENEELTEEQVKDHLDMLKEDRNAKIESYLYVISDLESKRAAKEAEIKRIKELADLDVKAIGRLKSWLLECMDDGEKHEFDLFKVTKVKGRQTVTVTDEGKIPMSLMAHKPESWQPDKRAILTELKNGKNINGVELSMGESSLKIK